MIKEEETFEDNLDLHRFCDSKELKSHNAKLTYETKIFEQKQFIIKLIIRLIIIIVQISLTIALVSINSYRIKTFLNNMSDQMLTTTFAYNVTINSILASLAAQDLLADNDTSYVQSVLTSASLQGSIDYLGSLQGGLKYALTSGSFTRDPEILDIILYDACNPKIFSGVFMNYCLQCKKGQETAGLIQLASNLQLAIQDVYDNYKSSDKNATTLFNMLYDTSLYKLRPYIVIPMANKYIAAKLDNGFDEIAVDFKNSDKTLSTLMYMTLVLVGTMAGLTVYLFWKDEANYRRLLRTIPAEIILSNFTLKLYLMKTSKESLDLAKSSV